MTRSVILNEIVTALSSESFFSQFEIRNSVMAVYPHHYEVSAEAGAILVSVLGSNYEEEKFNTPFGRLTRIRIALGNRSVIENSSKIDSAIERVYDTLSGMRIADGAGILLPVNDRSLTEIPSNGIFWSELIFKIKHYY